MNLFQSIILAIVQGVTEFLPISSTGHINLLQFLFGLKPSLTFDIFLNTASLFSVLFFFRKKTDYFFKNLKYIIVGTIPAIIAGLFFKSQIESIFASVKTIPFEFLFTAVILYLTKYFNKSETKLNYKKAILIGLFQALAIIPAISRSGSTIFAALLVGLAPIEAFNFSFSLFIPASFGALILDIKDLSSPNVFTVNNLLAFVITFIVGIFALRFLQDTLSGNKLWKFSFYALILSVVSFVILK